MNISIESDGSITMIYDDDFRDLFELGPVSISRVSNVEPNEKGEWVATMIDGTVLGPFPLRKDALDAEIAYLNSKLF